MFLTEGSNFTRMKNKYLTRSLCVTILSAMVLSSPMSVMAADEHIETASDLGDGSGEVISDGSDTPDTTAPAETTAAPTTTTDIDMGRVDESYVSLYGDVNCDGTIDILDAVLLQKYLNGSVQLNYTQLANADCQKDSELDNTDVTVIMQYLLRSFTSLPVA